VELSTEEITNMIDGVLNSAPPAPIHAPQNKSFDRVSPDRKEEEQGVRTVKKSNRNCDISLYMRVTQADYDLIQDRMSEAGTTNMAVFVHKMALNGYVLHVDLSPV